MSATCPGRCEPVCFECYLQALLENSYRDALTAGLEKWLGHPVGLRFTTTLPGSGFKVVWNQHWMIK